VELVPVQKQEAVGGWQDRRLGRVWWETCKELRDKSSIRPHATTLGGQPFLETDYEQFLLSVNPYDRSQHREFRELIERRLGIEIQYTSLYGDRFTAVWHWRGPNDHQALSAWE
jgi:hypothetical protein